MGSSTRPSLRRLLPQRPENSSANGRFRESAREVVDLLRRPRIASSDDLTYPAPNIRHRTLDPGFPPDPLPFVGASPAGSVRTERVTPDSVAVLAALAALRAAPPLGVDSNSHHHLLAFPKATSAQSLIVRTDLAQMETEGRFPRSIAGRTGDGQSRRRQRPSRAALRPLNGAANLLANLTGNCSARSAAATARFRSFSRRTASSARTRVRCPPP
jgi:hypothetical protein